MKGKEVSWLNYIGSIQEEYGDLGKIDTEGLEKILNINHHTHGVFNHTIPWIYLLDYTTGKYRLISESIKVMMGYEPSYFLDGGLGMVLDKFQKQHLRVFNEEIFPDRLKIMKEIPSGEEANYIFSYNLKIKNRKGDFLNLLQRNCFIKSDERGNPLLSFGVITNINHYKEENPIIQLVERIEDPVAPGGVTLLAKKAYYLNSEDGVFSKRELEILKWTIEGLTHKEIAAKLFIAPGTVLLHRKNMLGKSGARNVAELVGYAFRNHLV